MNFAKPVIQRTDRHDVPTAMFTHIKDRKTGLRFNNAFKELISVEYVGFSISPENVTIVLFPKENTITYKLINLKNKSNVTVNNRNLAEQLENAFKEDVIRFKLVPSEPYQGFQTFKLEPFK